MVTLPKMSKITKLSLLEADSSCVPYARRPEWSDITPLPVPAGDAGKVVSIQYSERHAEVLGYFRAILAKVGGTGVATAAGRGAWELVIGEWQLHPNMLAPSGLLHARCMQLAFCTCGSSCPPMHPLAAPGLLVSGCSTTGNPAESTHEVTTLLCNQHPCHLARPKHSSK